MGFRIHPQGIGNAIDVIEITDDLNCIVDGAIVKPGFAERSQVFRGHGLRPQGKVHGEGTERPICGTEGSLLPIGRDLMDKLVSCPRIVNLEICNLGTEVVGVCAYSIIAVVDGRNHRSQHFPLPFAERGTPVHQNTVEVHRCF